MSWHNGREWKAFQRREAAELEACRRAGMTEEQLQELLRFDREVFRSDRRFYRHIQDLPEPESGEEWRLMQEFPEAFTAPEPALPDWVEEIGDPALARWLRGLPKKTLELLTQVAFEGYTQTDLARLRNCSLQNINQVFIRLRAEWPKPR